MAVKFRQTSMKYNKIIAMFYLLGDINDNKTKNIGKTARQQKDSIR